MHQRLQQVLLQRLPQQAPDMLHYRACAQSSTGQQLRPERSWHISRPSLHPHPHCHSNFLPSKQAAPDMQLSCCHMSHMI